ncbi:site-specific DNA-methyltransferase [Lacrimispora amygdalina]|uniref:Site-specific DNA-methyltransferase n=2 Tax=Lacrimispora amygdalina TaxID=253257 RepID=A0A3E2NC64_9FIRM|nr:site-specific DNA-methyltransferase [Clostridium indicum]
MSHLLKEYRGKVDLIYIDPPFDSKADYKKQIKLKRSSIQGDMSSFEEKQYGDIWVNDEYLQFMYERLIIMKELLSDSGSIFLHCDWHKSAYLKIIMDEIFGNGGDAANGPGYKNEIIWQRTGAHNDAGKYGVIHDTIYWYTKSSNYKFEMEMIELTEEHKNSRFKTIEQETGRRFYPGPITAPGDGPSRLFRGKELLPPAGRHWSYSQENIDKLEKENRIYYSSTGIPYLKEYEDEYTQQGRRLQSIWTDILPSKTGKEIVGYPTQKPEKLLERIINATTKESDVVFDCFMGSGTTAVVAQKKNRRFIGADINLAAVQITTKRLLENESITGFELYNVNNYDFFRNPVEAKGLIIDALGIQKYDSSTVYDGELDGYMVKIMPTNRIATKADLEELKANLPYKTFEKRKEENPGAVVERIKIVCMGHEADLKASLEQELSAYKLDIEIVDILRDKSDLQFKREADANVVKENSTLTVKEFYPMNLLQKLSMQKESVEDWRQLVESIFVDWNYDGETMRPEVCDIPGKDDLVAGVYEIPDSAGRIKIKITDLLSESLEMEV